MVATDRAEVIEWSDKLVHSLRGNPAFSEVASEAQEGGPRMQIEVDREQAGRLGVSMQSVTDTLNDAFGQRQISTIYGQANQYRVILEAQPRYQQDPNALVEALCYRRQHVEWHRGNGRQYRYRHDEHQHDGHAQCGDEQQSGAACPLSPALCRHRRRSPSRIRNSFLPSPSAST